MVMKSWLMLTLTRLNDFLRNDPESLQHPCSTPILGGCFTVNTLQSTGLLQKCEEGEVVVLNASSS